MNIFLGKNVDVLQVMHEVLGVDRAVAEFRPNLVQMKEYCDRYKIDFRELLPGRSLSDVLPPRCDLVVIASFATILKQGVIDRCKLILNFHGGLVQSCRGRHPLPSAILNQHKFMGITCHVIDSEKIDEGPVVGQILAPLDYQASFRVNDQRLAAMFPPLARAVLDEYSEAGRVVAEPVDLDPGGYFPPVEQLTMDQMFAARSLAEFVAKFNS